MADGAVFVFVSCVCVVMIDGSVDDGSFVDKRVAEAVAAGDDRACEMRGVCGAGVVRLGVGSPASSRVLLVLWFLKNNRQ